MILVINNDVESGARSKLLLLAKSKICSIDFGTNELVKDGEVLSILLAKAGEIVTKLFSKLEK